MMMSSKLFGASSPPAKRSSLLIDSNALNRNLTKIYMEVAGCDVSTCEDYGQAASLLSDPPCEADTMFGLVVIDSRTIIHHFRVLRAIRSRASHKPYTISIIPEHRRRVAIDLSDAGSNMVVTYPYATREFLGAIHRGLTTPAGRNSESLADRDRAHPVAIRQAKEEAVAAVGC